MSCRFYGKNGIFGVLIEQHGNQCALMTGSHSPCQMETAGAAVDETACDLVRVVAETFDCGLDPDHAAAAERWVTGRNRGQKGAMNPAPDPELLHGLVMDVSRARLTGFALPVSLDIASALEIIAMLQVGLRHPGTKDSNSAATSREFIDGVIRALRECGFEATAKIAELGDRPEFDV